MSTEGSTPAKVGDTSAEIAALLNSINAFNKRLGRQLTKRQEDFSMGTWLLLRRLASSSPSQPGAIAKQVSVSRQRVQKQIAALAEKGLVTSQEDPADERRKLVELTPAGRARLAELDAVVTAEAAEFPPQAVARAQMQIKRLVSGTRDKPAEGRKGKAGSAAKAARQAAKPRKGGGQAGRGTKARKVQESGD